jgi:putative chitobiose transport system substrate-binding protein
MANRQLLQRAGLERPPLQWQDLPAYAEAVRRRTGRYALFMTVVPDDSAELLETLVQQGVQLLDDQRRAAFDSDAGRQAFAFWSGLYRRGLLPREVVSQGYRRAIELYQSGDLAQVATGPDFLRNLQTNAPGIAAVTAPFPPFSGPGGAANVAVMNLVVPRQSAMASEAVSFGLFLTNAANQLTFAEQARVLPSARAALAQLEARLRAGPVSPGSGPDRSQQQLVQRARLLAAETLGQARVLVPAMPGIKRLQAILYTQLQRAMLGELSSARALAAAGRSVESLRGSPLALICCKTAPRAPVEILKFGQKPAARGGLGDDQAPAQRVWLHFFISDGAHALRGHDPAERSRR